MNTTVIIRSMALGAMMAMLGVPGCDDYERQQLREAGENLDAAADNVGNATQSSFDRARNGTADALRNLSDDIETHNQRMQQAADDATGR